MDTYGSVKRRLVGLVIEGNEKDLPEAGAKLFSGTREVGWVSSATFSPLLQKPIALGFPLRDFAKPDTKLEVETQGKKFPASVNSLPFTPPTQAFRDSAET
jgi:glycine cleavage system aminomethyltransferase T